MAGKEEEKSWFLGKLWEQVSGFFVVMFSAVWKEFSGVAVGIFELCFYALGKLMPGSEERDWNRMLDWFVRPGVLAEDEKKQLMRYKDLTFPLDEIMFYHTLFSLAKTYITVVIYGASAKMRRAVLTRFTPERPPADSMIAAAFVAPEKTNEIRNKIKELGFDDEDIDLMFISHYRLYDEGNIKKLWLRKVLTDDEMFMRMRELGFTDKRTKELVQGWSVIPGPGDLFHLVAKEAFEPDMIERMGYKDEFPEEQVDWLQKQGISRYWAEKYWYAHWETPSIQMGFEMLHREDPDKPGQSVINDEELDMLFRTVEVPPYWRDKMTKVAYSPYTRVDVRRMHKMGVLTDRELVQSYKDLGYDEQHAQKMCDFTVQYNQGAAKELTKTQIMGGYKDKLLTREDTLILIQDLGYNEAQAEYFLVTEDYNEAKSLQADLIKNIKIRFQHNLCEEFETRNKLNELSLPQARVDLLLDQWKIKKFVDMKKPSKTDLHKFLKAGVINSDTYNIEMRNLGYSFKYTSWYEAMDKIAED